MIKVGFDISQLAHTGGVATYTRELAEELSKLDNLEMVYFFSSLRKKAPLFIHGNIKSYHLPPTLFEVLFNRVRNVGIEKFIGIVDIFHSSDWVQPPSQAKKVTTYHDIVPLKYPEWSHPKIVAVQKRRLKIMEQEIDMVIAVSNSTKKDLIEISKISAEKIKVIYEGPTGQFKPQPQSKIKLFKKKYKLPDNFILAIGGIGERKNLKRIKMATQDYNLVVSGQDIPWLDIQELELLYSSAKLLLYPSLYEGFGIPILDAFLCGVPVITSSVSSMPEVGGDGAAYVNPFKVDEMKKKIKQVLEDKNLRGEMIKKGFVQASKFSWQKCARETGNIYEELINK